MHAMSVCPLCPLHACPLHGEQLSIRLASLKLLTFLEPARPSDSVKKKAKGRRKKRERLQQRNTWFHKPALKMPEEEEEEERGGGGGGGGGGERERERRKTFITRARKLSVNGNLINTPTTSCQQHNYHKYSCNTEGSYESLSCTKLIK